MLQLDTEALEVGFQMNIFLQLRVQNMKLTQAFQHQIQLCFHMIHLSMTNFIVTFCSKNGKCTHVHSTYKVSSYESHAQITAMTKLFLEEYTSSN